MANFTVDMKRKQILKRCKKTHTLKMCVFTDLTYIDSLCYVNP